MRAATSTGTPPDRGTKIEGAAPRALLLALDAVPPELIERWCKDGSLPNIERLRRSGRYGRVTSDAGLFPVSVWPTFHTGTGAGQHGIYHGVQWDPDRMRIRTVGFRGWGEVRPFWQLHADAGVPVLAFDVPFSIYTGPGSGTATEVLGWGADAQIWAYSRPLGLLSELNRRFGKSSQKRDVLGLKPQGWLAKELTNLRDDVARRGRIIEHLLSRFDWRIGVAAFSEVHKAGHWYWGSRVTEESHGGLKLVLQDVDREVGRLHHLLQPADHLAVFSIHGMGPIGDTDRFSEAIWRYLEPAHVGTPRRTLDPIHALRALMPTEVLRDLSGRLPKSVYIRAHQHYLNAGRNWSRYKTVSLHPELNYYLRANVRGRERDGRLSEDEAERHIEWLVEELRGLKAHDGGQIFEEVVRVGPEHQGPGRRLLPDIVGRPVRREIGESILARDGTSISAPRLFEQDGHHLPDGFYIQVGPGIASGEGPTTDGAALAAFLLAPTGLSA